MKYLLNLPLAVAALLQVWFASLVFMSAPWSGWSDGPSRGAMVLVMLEPVALAWILLLPVIAGSVFADAFDWLPVRRRWLQLTLVLGASVLVGVLVIPCVLVAIGGSAAVGQTEEEHFGPVLIGGATIAATIVPGWYDGSDSRWSTDYKRHKLFDKKHDARPVCDELRSRCPRNAKVINIEAAQNDLSLDAAAD
jgi:hypothetical protein